MAEEKNFLSYEEELNPMRKAFADEISMLFDIYDERQLLLFWINFCSLGIGMTEQVSDWIKRAGEASIEKGFSELGKLLVKHAKAEEGHEIMMIKDMESLIILWNMKYKDKLDASVFYDAKDQSKSINDYIELHEKVIEGLTPYCQLAIEYEIENLSVAYGPKLLMKAQEIFGPGIVKSLSFLDHHIALDEGHTNFNRNSLNKFLIKNPSSLSNLIYTGKNALKIYHQFLLESYNRALKYDKEREYFLI